MYFLWILGLAGEIYVQRVFNHNPHSFDENTINYCDISDYLEEIGEAFRIQNENILNEESKHRSHQFFELGPIIQAILGLESSIYLKEQDDLLSLLDKVYSNGYNEQFTIKQIVDFLDQLDDVKLGFLLLNIVENLAGIFNNARCLSKL